MVVGGGEPASLATGVRVREANRGFGRLLVISVALHGALGAGGLYAATLRPSRSIDPPTVPVELVTLGRPRDPKLLPRRSSAAPRRQKERTSPPPKDAVPLDANGDAKKARPKASSGKRRATDPDLSDAARRLLEGADPRLDQALEKLETPEGRPEGSPLGTTTDSTNAARAYEAQLAAVLKSRYQMPATIPPSQRRFLEARVALFIDGRGRVTRYEFVERHANMAFMSALEGLLKTVELPAPPLELAPEYASKGVEIHFKP